LFSQNFAGGWVRQQRIFADFKTGFLKGSCTPTYVPISSWGFEQHILRKIIRKPQICYERWSTSAQSKAHIGFAAKKAALVTNICDIAKL
jgi:hypothetical protein